MSGEHSRDDELDFLDDDFVLEEDVVEGAPPAAPAVNDPRHAVTAAEPATPTESATASDEADLDELFAIPAGEATADEVSDDAEDVLFAVPAAAPAATFGEPVEFAETAPSEWESETFDLAAEAGHEAPLSREAVDAVTEELERELAAIGNDEVDLVVDSDEDLELVDAPELAASELRAAISPADRSEESAAAFGDEHAAAAADEELPTLEPWDDSEGVAASPEAGVADYVDGEVAAEPIDPEWAPLDAAALADAEPEVENPYAAEYYAQETELANSEGSDLYVEDEAQAELAPVIGGPRQQRRWGPILTSVAASLAIAASGAVVVVRPEWFGLSFAPEMVPAAQVERPQLAPPVTAPALPALPVAEPSGPAAIQSPADDAAGGAAAGSGVTPVPVEPDVPPGTEPVPQPQAQPAEPASTPTQPEPAPVVVAHQVPTIEPIAPSPAPPATLPGVPVPVVVKSDPQPLDTQKLVRVDDHLLVGGQIELPPQKPVLADGVTIGSRAFAQLDNGNYFIGSVKRIDEASLTLKLDHGEVSIPNETIVRLAKLGVGDYEALIKMTQGSVRLTNNNKLVGSIVSDIADDHVVLEFRSNRVVLPKSAIGGIVEGADDSGVRLDTTKEEQDWLRKLVEREIGTGQGPSLVKTAPVAPNAAPGAVGPTTPRQPAPAGSGPGAAGNAASPVPPAPSSPIPPSPIPPR